MKLRNPLYFLLCLAVSGAALAQENMVHFRIDVEAAIAEAKKKDMPLMFYVTRSADSRDQDLERDQKRSFRDERVFELSKRFICVQMSHSQYKDQIAKWGFGGTSAQLYVVYAMPDGTKIDTQSPLGVASAQGFAQKMAKVYDFYRNSVYEKEIKAKISEKSPVGDIKTGLEKVKALTILSADKDVAKLLQKEDLDEKTRGLVYDVLAVLSTKASVEALVGEVKSSDDKAAKALQDVTPGAAAFLLPLLDKEGPARIAAYSAVVKVCKIKNPKPAKFWDGKNERPKAEEIERVKKAADGVIKRWKEQYDEYR